MFKIESYITPIIINYIDKYVKDFRPQNAQVGQFSIYSIYFELNVASLIRFRCGAVRCRFEISTFVSMYCNKS